MGKKNKKGSGSGKEGASGSGSQQGASGGGQPGEKKKDSGQGSADQQDKQKSSGGQQHETGGQQQQQKKQPKQQARDQSAQQKPPQQQPQESQQKQQAPKQQQQPQQPQAQRSQQSQEKQPQQQKPQGSWGQQQPQQSQGPPKQAQQQTAGSWGQQEPKQQGAWQQQQQPKQGQHSQGGRPQRQERQPSEGARSLEGGHGHQQQRGPRQDQGGQYQQRGQGQDQGGQYQQRGPRQDQGGQYKQRDQQQRGPRQDQGGQYQQRGQGQDQGGQYQQRGPRQDQGGQYQQHGPRQDQGGQYKQRDQQQRGPRQDQGDQYQQRGPRPGQGDQYQPQQPQTIVQLSPAHASSPARGTRGQPFSLETNYITLDLDKMPDVAYHYDVNIDPDRPKKFVRQAFNAFMKKVCPNIHLAYDGKANAYSVDLLPEAILKVAQNVEVTVTEDSRNIPFKVSLKPTDDIKIDLKSLKTYHKDRIFDKPMRALQCIEVVLSSPCHEKAVRAGRSFFMPPKDYIDLGDGFELWLGLYQAAMLCDQPLLNVDVSHKSFPSKVNLVTFYDRLRGSPQRALGDFLKGLRVNYTPPPCFKSSQKGFKFLKVMDASSKQLFKTEDGKQQTVAAYYVSKGFTLKRPDLPCLHVGSSVKNIYIPLELLDVPVGQAIMRKDNENQVRQMIRFAATSTDERKMKIMRLLDFFKYNIHPTVQRFGLSVGNQFINIPARLLQTPKIEYAGGKTISIQRPGEWMMQNVNFLKCDQKVTHQWAIINISAKPEINELFLRQNFVDAVSKSASKVGMNLSSKCLEIIQPSVPGTGRSDGFRRPAPISIEPYLKKLKANKVSIVFVILPFASESYAKVKQEAELSCGIVTQCIKGDTMRSESRNRGVQIINQMTISNILLKVNAKLNGTNHRISPGNEISLQRGSKIMFVGADVSHPSPLQKNLPSIVGVVASHDEFGTQYNMQYRLQSPGEETIQDMQDIFAQHLRVYKANMKVLPDNIIYYRDGVSDGQFKLIENVELLAMRAACKAAKCNPKFTCIIVVKRHHTRFFPKASDGEGKFNNVKAGTVVDRTIIHPGEVQFFMVSHKAIQGTSKPTRYNVIVDDAKIQIDDLQAMTYNLCHLFPRCNRSVSYPAPAYLSHLVGLRGRAYIEGKDLNLDNLKAEYSKRLVSEDVMKMNPMYFV